MIHDDCCITITYRLFNIHDPSIKHYTQQQLQDKHQQGIHPDKPQPIS